MAGSKANSTIKTYLVHPKEWKFGIFLLVVIAYARVFHFQRSFNNPSRFGGLFENSHSQFSVQDSLKEYYCLADRHILCGNLNLVGGCNEFYGNPLGFFLGVGHDSVQDAVTQNVVVREGHNRNDKYDVVTDNIAVGKTKNCSLVDQFSKISFQFQQGESLEGLSQEKKTFVAVFIASIARMCERDNFSYFSSFLERYTSSDWERLVRFYLSNMLYVFSESKARKITQEDWSREEVLDLMESGLSLAKSSLHVREWVLKNSASTFKIHIAPRMTEVLHELRRKSPDGLVPGMYEKNGDKAPYKLFELPDTNQCMDWYQRRDRLITTGCRDAMALAPLKLREIELESGGDFLEVSHFFMFGVNIMCCLVLLSLFNSRQRLERRMEKGKKRLEQELSDPFLRESLERKAQKLPTEEKQNFIAKLEHRAATWDSKTASLKLLRRRVRRFRLVVVFYVFLTTLMYLLLHIFHVSSMARYLEIAFLSILMLVISHAVPIGNSDKEMRPSEIMMGTLDPASTQALLPDVSNPKPIILSC